MKNRYISFSSCLLIIAFILNSCINDESKNCVEEDLTTISSKIKGVWVDNNNSVDTVLIQFFEVEDSKKSIKGIISYDFTIQKNGYRINKLHEPTLILSKTNNLISMTFNPFFGESEDREVVFINDKIMKFKDGAEYTKLSNLE